MRVKIILPNFIAVLLFGVASYFYLDNRLQKKAKEDLRENLQVITALFARSEGLRGFELLNNVRAQAMSRDMVTVFEKVEVDRDEGQTSAQVDAKIHRIWFKKCVQAIEKYADQWQSKYHKRPDLVLITDRRGVALARNTTPNACPVKKNVADGMSVVTRALDGQAAYAIWSNDSSPFSKKKKNSEYCQLMNTDLLELAAAPIWLGDDIAGTLVVGFDISDGTATKHSKLTSMEVAVLKGESVYSTSLGTETARESLEKTLTKANIIKSMDKSLQAGRISDVFDLVVEDRAYLAQIVPMTNAETKDRVATLMMASVDKSFQNLRGIKSILVAMAITLLIVFVSGMLLANHFMKPIIEIEEGVLKVINGEYQYRFDVKSSEVGGLSFRINQMIGALTEDEEEGSANEDPDV